ncbi:unnamed protein product [Closterium sp. NIES-65]|nr:unnamed protein product [Closterium sp. NIES-65]
MQLSSLRCAMEEALLTNRYGAGQQVWCWPTGTVLANRYGAGQQPPSTLSQPPLLPSLLPLAPLSLPSALLPSLPHLFLSFDKPILMRFISSSPPPPPSFDKPTHKKCPDSPYPHSLHHSIRVNTSQTEMLLEDLFDLKAIIKALPKGIVFADSDDWKQTLAAAQDAQTLADARKKNPPKKEGDEGGVGGEEEEDETPAQYLVVEDGSVSWRELRDVPDYAEAKIVHRKDDRPWRRVCATRFNGTAVIYHGPPFAKYIRDLAMQLSEKLGHFVFLHVRRHNTDIMRDDASYLRCRHLDRDTRVPAIRRHIWRLIPENSTLYIATDEVNPGFFSGLRQWYDIRLARSFDHILKGKVTNNYQVFAIEKHLSKFASFFVATFCDEADSYGWLGLHAFYCLCQDYQEGRRAQTIKDTSAG